MLKIFNKCAWNINISKFYYQKIFNPNITKVNFKGSSNINNFVSILINPQNPKLLLV